MLALLQHFRQARLLFAGLETEKMNPMQRGWAPAAIAQLAARRSHNPKVVSSILTRRIFPDLAEGLAYSVRSNVPECIGQQNEAGNMFMHHEKKTVCPSGLRGWTQVPLAQAAWVQIPQVSRLWPASGSL